MCPQSAFTPLRGRNERHSPADRAGASHPQSWASDHEFISTWQTTAHNDGIIIPTQGSGYNYTIDCGMGGLISGAQMASGRSGNSTCTYATAGDHIIVITSTFPRIYFNGTAAN